MRPGLNTILIILVWANVVTPPVAWADEIPAATPYRPNVANGADLTAPGYFELEGGFLRVKSPDSWTTSFPVSLKYAFNKSLGMFITHNAATSLRDNAGDRLTGPGDTSLSFKYKHPLGEEDDAPALGLIASVNIPTSKNGLGSSEADYSLVGIYSADFADWHGDLNLSYTQSGTVDDGVSEHLYGWAAALSYPINERWGATAELSGTAQRGAAETAQFLGFASYSVTPQLVLDGGAAWGLNKASPDWALFFGFTALLY